MTVPCTLPRSSMLLGPWDLLDPASPVVLATGWDRSAPAPTTSSIQASVLDGAAVYGVGSGNRSPVLPVIVHGADRVDLAATVNRLLTVVGAATWELTFIPAGGLPVVYDCYRAAVTVTSAGIRQEDEAFTQSLQVACSALPFGRSPAAQTVTLSGESVQVEGFNDVPPTVAATARYGRVAAVYAAPVPAYEGTDSLAVDYDAGYTTLVIASPPDGVSVPVPFQPSTVTLRVRAPASSPVSMVGEWSLKLYTDQGEFDAVSALGGVLPTETWAAVAFDVSAVPAGCTIIGWSVTTPLIYARGATITSRTFTYTGAAQSFTVPSGVVDLGLDLKGAASVAGNGAGDRILGGLPVTGGDTFGVYVGGVGKAPVGTTGGVGGWNGGGAGGNSSGGVAGYGGSGATDIRSGGTALTDRVAVAGGAGGGGRNGPTGGALGGPAGRGGYPNGGAGGTGLGSNAGGGGGGGTQSAGGAAGAGGGAAVDGHAGSLGQGGAGSNHVTTNFRAGGGGGGGYYGGGGAGGGGVGSSGGGGGGSSWVDAGRVTGLTHIIDGGGGQGVNGTAVLSWQSIYSMYFDDLRIYPASVTGVSDANGGLYLLSGVAGSARAPLNLALTAADDGNFSSWLVHSPPPDRPAAQALIPLGSAPSPAWATGIPAGFGGVYDVYVVASAVASAGTGRAWTVTVDSTLGGPTSTITATVAAQAGQMFYIGSMVLPTVGQAPEATGTLEFSVASALGDNFADLLLLDTRGQTILVESGAPSVPFAWVDEPDPTVGLGGVWSGTAADRSDALALTEHVSRAGLLFANPGDSQLLVYSPTGALAASVTYYPRWQQEATA